MLGQSYYVVRNIYARLYLFSQWAIYAQDCTYFLNAQDCTYFPNAQYMHKICARLYLFLQCTIYAQDLCKIVLISPMHNICARFAQDCTSFPNAQYMCKICARLDLFPQCTIYAQDCTWPPGQKNETKIPTPGHNLPCSNAKKSMKKEHNSIKAVSFQIFQFSIIVHLTFFF